MIATIAFAVLSLALLAALIYRERLHDQERRELIDRLTVPEAARSAAFARALPDIPAPPDTDKEDDAAYGRPILEPFDFLEVN